MNLYVVTEGKAEAAVYSCWIPLVNPVLTRAFSLSDINNDSFFLISAKGYPG
jgi:hypothetical protein